MLLSQINESGLQQSSCRNCDLAPLLSFTPAGMLCIGVTTSLSEADMRAQSPDAVYPQIGRIDLEHLLSLKEQQSKLFDGRSSNAGQTAPTQVDSAGG